MSSMPNPASTPPPSCSRPLRWGILGCARITRRGLIPGIQSSEHGRLVGLASRNGTTAQAWGSEFGVPKVFDSYEALLADPDIDAVYIPLPNELHLAWVLAAADAGKHVLCEKPLARNAVEAAAMVAHCQAQGVLLMEAFMWRHQPRTARLRDLVAAGAIGTLRLVRSTFSFSIEPGDWRLDPARGGGALWDVGCYGVSTARLFTGQEPVEARALAHWSSSGVDLTLGATLRFPDGVLAVIDCSFEQPFRSAYELVGTRGAIEVPQAYLPTGPTHAQLLGLDGTVREQLRFDDRDQYACMVDAFAQSVAAGRLLEPAENGLDQMQALDAILEAARPGSTPRSLAQQTTRAR